MPERYVGGGKMKNGDGDGEGEVGGETESWVRYRYYMHYAEGSLMPYLVIALLLSSEFLFFLSPFFLSVSLLDPFAPPHIQHTNEVNFPYITFNPIQPNPIQSNLI